MKNRKKKYKILLFSFDKFYYEKKIFCESCLKKYELLKYVINYYDKLDKHIFEIKILKNNKINPILLNLVGIKIKIYSKKNLFHLNMSTTKETNFNDVVDC